MISSYSLYPARGSISTSKVPFEVREVNGVKEARQSDNHFAPWRVINEIPSGAVDLNKSIPSRAQTSFR